MHPAGAGYGELYGTNKRHVCAIALLYMQTFNVIFAFPPNQQSFANKLKIACNTISTNTAIQTE